MESLINTLNSLNIAELIAFIFVAYFLIKQPLDKRLDSQDKRFDDQGKRLDDLKDMFKSELQANKDLFKSELRANRDLFKSELESKIKPIEIALNNHITDTTKEIKALNNRITDTQKDIQAINKKLDKIINLKENKA